jgi:hypothetical protein
MTLIFSHEAQLPRVPADVQAYLDYLNTQGFRFDKLYVPGGDKDLEVEVYHTVQPTDMENIAVCTDEAMAERMIAWAKQLA